METELSPRLVRVRCPNCRKLFGVEFSELKGEQHNFSCSKCQTHFFLRADDVSASGEALGRQEEPAVPANHSPIFSAPLPTAAPSQDCPRCQAVYRAGDRECPKCGVVFAKLKYFISDGPIEVSPELRRQWWHALEDYENIEKHHRFIRACQRDGQLAYAGQQYRRVLEAHAGDEIAQRMQNEIRALVSIALEPRRTSKNWAGLTMPRLSTLFMLIGAVLMAIGLVHDLARNLVGLGAAVLFFTASVRWYLQSQE